MMARLGAAVIVLMGALVATGCTGFTGLQLGTMQGSGNAISTEYDFSNFEKVSVANAFTVAIEQGDSYAVRVTVDDNLVDRLIVAERGDTLVIEMRPGIYNTHTLRAEITMPRLTGVKLSGASHATLAGFAGADAVDVGLSGAAQLAGDLSATDAKVDISGASHLTLRGAARALVAKASGASHLNLGEFAVERATVDLSGASTALVNVSQALDASASGASSVEYLGSPAQVHESSSGASSIRPH